MKKQLVLTLALAGLVSTIGLVGCGSGGGNIGCTVNCGGGGGSETIKSITGAAFESAGEPDPYPYTCVTSTGSSCTWSSSNTNFLTINTTTGEATALAAGTVTITATATDNSNVSKTIDVTVGNRMVFSQIRGGTLPPQISTVDVDSSKTTLLPSLVGTNPTFSGGNSNLFFQPTSQLITNSR